MIPPQKKSDITGFQEIGNKTAGHRVLIYGPGGIGKTTLGCMAPGRVAFVDAEDSLPILKDQLAASKIPLPIILPADNWSSLRAGLSSDIWKDIKTIVLEITRIEEWAIKHTLATVRSGEKTVGRLEDYGYGKGYQHVFETFLTLLSDLDRHARQGRNVILIAHDCVKNVPNPSGEDWIRYEPRLQDAKQASIRLRVKEWSDHTLFFSYDVAVDKEGKGKGSGTRTIYTAELPHFMAKSRTIAEAIPVEPGADPWTKIIK